MQTPYIPILLVLLPLAAGGQTFNFYKFTPPVIRSVETQNILLEMSFTGLPTRVALDFDPAGSQPLLDLVDNGTNGDRLAGDGIYSVTLTPAQILQGLAANDVFMRFLGFARVFQGAAIITSINIFADIHTPEIPAVTVQQLAPDMQSTDTVVNIFDPGYFSAISSGVDLNRPSKRLYQRFGDVYDMINLVTAANYGANRFHNSLKNTVQGIGNSIFDVTGQSGSGGKLLGVNIYPVASFFDGANPGYIHEFGHQWVQVMHLAPFSSGIPHWPLSSMAHGVMGFSLSGGEGGNYACKVVPDTGGVRLVVDNSPKVFTDMDLYLMGFLPATQVSDHFVFNNQNDPAILNCNGQVYTGGVTTVHATDIEAAFGARVPSSANSQKQFRVATIVISPDGLLSPEAMARYTFFAKRAEAAQALLIHDGRVTGVMGNPFAVATGGLGSISTSLVSISPAALPSARFGSPYTQLFTQSGLLGTPIWSISGGALPSGISLESTTGELSGAPTAQGSSGFTVRVTSNGYFAERAYTLTAGKGAPVITVTIPTPNTTGNKVVYSVSVKPGAPGFPNPSGTVQFKLDGVAFGNPVTLVNGAASLGSYAPSSGIYAISASYSGDGNYLTGDGGGGGGRSPQQIVFQFSIRDDTSGNFMLFNTTAAGGITAGAFLTDNCSTSQTTTGLGAISIQPWSCTTTLTYQTIPTSQNLKAILNYCLNQGVVTNGALLNTLVLMQDANTVNNTRFCH